MTNKVSQIFGNFANKKFSKPFQNFINNSYVNILGLDMSEFHKPEFYESLNALFTRELLKPRHIDGDGFDFISPADSFITSQGKLHNNQLLQIKGMSYGVNELLGDYVSDENKKKVANGDYMNFYLSPKDYHRYHASFDCKVKKSIYVAGKLLPVNVPYLKKEQNLFVQNERVILECEHEDKIFYMIFVGALNVGQMVFEFENRVETNTNAKEMKVYTYDNIEISRGECLGYFKMGSTVVMIWEKDMVNLENLLDKNIKFGEKIVSIL